LLATSVSEKDFIWVVGSLAQMHRLPFDSKLLLQRFPPPYLVRSLIEAGQALGLRIAESSGIKDLARIHYPSVTFLRPGSDGEDASPRPAILVKSDGERVLYFQAGSNAPKTAPSAEVPRLFNGTYLFVARESQAGDAAAEEDVPAAPARFGFRWFAAELLRHKTVWRDVLAASLFIQLIGLSTPLFTQVIIDKVVVHQTTSTLLAIAVGLAMFLAFNAGMTWLRQYLVLHTGNRVDAALGSQVFRHLLRLHLPYFEHRPTGTLVARIHAVETIREFMAGATVSLLLDLPFLFVFLAVMFAYSWQLTLIALAVLVLVAGAGAFVTPLLRVRLNRQFLLGARNQAFLTEYVSGIETVKSLQMEPRLEKRYDEMLASYLSAGFATRQLSNTYNVAANALEQAMTIAILCAGALLVMRNDGFTVGMLVAFQMFAARLSQPMLRLAGLWQEFQQASIAVKRLGDIMDAPPEPQTLTPARAAQGQGLVEVRSLSFRYSSELPWLYRDLNLALEPGKLTVLTGPSGSGKSTLAKLLMGFYQPTEGTISIDGRDLRHLSANELRQYFGIVPQETYLFSGTIYENLIAASPSAGFDDVVQACRIAEIHGVIEKLPKGYNTEIGEHGVGFSGGQKQRLAIARAILKRSRILIFDEATSSLDQTTADQFTHTVNRIKGHATILFIAHQYSKRLQVDDLIRLGDKPLQVKVMDEGRT
jgi:subfamily B ATP-binding cassette protein HlyB/CyaB